MLIRVICAICVQSKSNQSLKSALNFYLCILKTCSRMFIVIGFMLVGILVGYLLRSKKIRFIQGLIIALIWVLLFLLGLEIGSNKNVIAQFGKLGLEAFLIATAGTLGSVVLAKLLWKKRSPKSPKI